MNNPKWVNDFLNNIVKREREIERMKHRSDTLTHKDNRGALENIQDCPEIPKSKMKQLSKKKVCGIIEGASFKKLYGRIKGRNKKIRRENEDFY